MKKPVIIGALVGLGIWLFFVLVSMFAAQNEFKVDYNGDYVALFPSVWQGMKMMSPIWWILSAVAATGGIALAASQKDNSTAGQAMTPAAAIALVSLATAFFLQHSPATAQQDFTHKTIPIEQFNEKEANKGNYDKLFHHFNQPDSLYLGPAVFRNNQ